MNKIIEKLHLKDVGFLEMMFALYPILMGYQYGKIPLAILVLLIMIALAYNRQGRLHIAQCKPMLYLMVFIVLHLIIWLFVIDNVTGSYYNNAIFYIIIFTSFFVIGPALDYKKMVGAINWVTLLVLFGLLYQLTILFSGGLVQPIKLPFLPEPDTGRFSSFVLRPTSFFQEPQSVVSFLIIPLFLSLKEKLYPWIVVLAVSMLLTTSTTGIVFVFAVIGLTIMGNRKSMSSVVFFILVLFALYYVMMNSDYFAAGTEKLMNSDVTTDNRTAQGWWICSSMPYNYWILGAPFEDALHYYLAGGAASNAEIVIYGQTIYMSTFWMVIFHFGIIGLLFYIAPYTYMIKRDKTIMPFMVCLLMALFSNPDFIKGAFLFDMLFAYVYINRNIIVGKYDSHSHRVRVR